MSAHPALQTEGLTKRYGDVTAVDGLDLTVERGEVFGFLGPNGAGKTTTINVLLDVAKPTAGTATVLGHDAQTETMAVHRRAGVLPDGFDLYDRLTGRQHVRFAVDSKAAADDPDALLDRVGLADAGGRAVGGYSRGMKQRLALAMALSGDPELLVLDEPQSGLDPNGMREVREIVREAAADGTTVFFSSHILSEVEAVCDRVGILRGGQLVAVDTVEGLRGTVGGGARLRLAVDRQPSVDLRVDGVSDVVAEDGHVEVVCTDPRAKARVVERALDDGVAVLDLETEEASLEDLFAAYTEGEA